MKHKLTLLVLLCLSIAISGCSVIGIRDVPDKLTQSYQINIISSGDKKPIEGATVVISSNDIPDDIKLTTNSDGKIDFDISKIQRKKGGNIFFKSSGKLHAEKDGYMQEDNKTFDRKSNWRYGNSNIRKEFITIKMKNIDDYLCDKIINSNMYIESKNLATWFYYFSYQDEMMLDNICTDTYKGKEYFSIKMDSTIKFNENRLSDYGVVKRLFISPIIDYVKSSRYISSNNDNLYGSMFSITTKIEDFTKDGTDIGRIIVLKYYIPKESIKEFLNQNISRQELIDKSVLLVNDDLIKVKFQ